MHYYPQTSFGWTTNLSAYKARPSFWPPAEITSQSDFLCIRLGQSHRVSHKYMSSMYLVTEDAKILWETKLLRPPGNRRLFLRCGRDEAWTANFLGLTWVCNLVYFHQVVRVWTHPGTSWRYNSAISRSSSPWWSVRHHQNWSSSWIQGLSKRWALDTTPYRNWAWSPKECEQESGRGEDSPGTWSGDTPVWPR